MATYTIIGADQKQYGLVTPDDLSRWIADGRVNEQTLIKAEGDAEFRPLADFPEFADALAARAAATMPAPLLSAETASSSKTSGLAVASLVLGILGLFTCGATALIGLILGIVALSKIKKNQGALGGRGLALAGTIVSVIFLLIIPICAALLLPVLAQARLKAQTINCASHVKQLSLAMRRYVDDNQSHYPAATNWCDAIEAHVDMEKTFRCPGDVSGGRCSYAFNARLSGAESGRVDPSTVVIFEADGGWDASGGPELMLTKPRHRHTLVVGFADGHVESVPDSELSRLRWNP